MRIAIPIHSFEPGGVERVALRLAEHWRHEGHEPVIVLGRRRGACVDTAPDLDYRVITEPFPTDRWETVWMIWSFCRFLLKEKVDAIFCSGNTYTIVCVAMKLLLGDRCPPVLVKISNDLERRDLPRVIRPAYRWWLRIQGSVLDGFVAIAAPMLAEIERELALPDNRVTVIPDPALSEDELHALAGARSARDTKGGCRFLTIGRLATQKNQMLLLEAFARHAWAQDTLVIAGDGPERDRLIRQVDALGLHSQVRFVGHVDEVLALYAEADVFVLSSNYEGAPAVILEALAAGLPIAATNCCVSMEWLTGYGQFGVLAPPGEPDALSDAMRAARHSRPDAIAMQRLAAGFTLESSGQLYLSRLAALAADFRRRRREKMRGDVRVWRGGGV
ncbi:MAG TPA: glycosyltransferase [Sphingomonas sp.]|nr:glycosyltransferase [Sphingomonas sp.]